MAQTLAEREGFRMIGVRVGTGNWSPPDPYAELLVMNGADQVRSLRTARFEDGWSFSNDGEPFAFEDPKRYTARRIRDRFDFELLSKYVSALGWNFCDPAIWEHDGCGLSLVFDWESS